MTEREFYNKMLGIPSPIIDKPNVTGRTGIINRPGTPSASDNTYNGGSRWESLLGNSGSVQNRGSTEPIATISHSRSDYGNPLRDLLPRLKNIFIQIIMSLAEKELKLQHLGGVLIQKLTQIPVTNAIKCL